jgi:hypothetical protein
VKPQDYQPAGECAFDADGLQIAPDLRRQPARKRADESHHGAPLSSLNPVKVQRWATSALYGRMRSQFQVFLRG